MENVEVRVKPSSKKGPSFQLSLDGGLLVYVREPAQEVRANVAVRDASADYFEVSKTSVQMISGKTSKIKKYSVTFS